MASKTMIDANSITSRANQPNSIDITKDLLQRLAELTAKTGEFIEKVDGIEPAMNTIYNLRDQMENLENRTITIVSQFQEQIFMKEDQADQIILDLNEEVQRIEDHIDDLLGLAEGFESIVDEINALLLIDDRVQELEKYVTSVETSTPTIVVGKDEEVERTEGYQYMVSGDTIQQGDTTYIEISYEDYEGNVYSFKTSTDTVYFDTSDSNLFQGLSNLTEILETLDTVVSNKVSMMTYYANLTADYSGSSAPYTQTVSVPGILTTDEPLVGLISDANDVSLAISQEKSWANVSRIVTNNNSITVYCNKKKPEVALNLRLVVFRTS